MSQSKWLFIPKPRLQPNLRLICFPYAGGSASTYQSWIELLPNNVELVSIQLPGRSNRISDPCLSNMDALIHELLPSIRNIIDMPYILFGHSLGSKIAFELMCQLHRMNAPMPIHFIASGSKAPHIPYTGKEIYSLPEKEFLNELLSMNGTPKELIESNELMTLLLPALKADFMISHDYYCTTTKKFDCPISVLGGTEDTKVSRDDLKNWETNFTSPAKIHMIPGDHFFIDSHKHLVLRKINMIIKSYIQNLMLGKVL